MLREERGVAMQAGKDDSVTMGKKKVDAGEALQDGNVGSTHGDETAGTSATHTAVTTATRPATAPATRRAAPRKHGKRRMASTKGRISPVTSNMVLEGDGNDASDEQRKGHFLARVKQGMSKFVSFRRGSDALADDSATGGVSSTASSSSSAASGATSLSSSVRGTPRSGASAPGRTASVCVHPGLPTLRYDWSHRMSTNAHLTREEQNRQGTRLKTQTSYMAKMAAYYENVFECYSKYVHEPDAGLAFENRRNTCPPAPHRIGADTSATGSTPRDAAMRVRARLRRLSRTEGDLTALDPPHGGSSTGDGAHGNDHDTARDSDDGKDNSSDDEDDGATGRHADGAKGCHDDGDEVLGEPPVHWPSPLSKMENGHVVTPNKLEFSGRQRRGSSFAGWSSSQRNRRQQQQQQHRQGRGRVESHAADAQKQKQHQLRQQRAKSMHEPRRRPSYHPWPLDWDPHDCDSAMGQRGSMCIPPPSITRQ